MGPVPNNFNSIFEYLANKDEIDIYYTNFADGGTGEQFKPNSNRTFNVNLFSEEELEILNNVAERLHRTLKDRLKPLRGLKKDWTAIS